MSITLNPEQEQAMEQLRAFVTDPATDTFVLKGYAGTGKTYLMQCLGQWLAAQNKDFKMLASTGRAATVLRGKTGFEARTVHGELYSFNRIDGGDGGKETEAEKWGQLILQFELRAPDTKEKLYIVDEASMLSSQYSDNDFAAFGTGVLLDDLFHATGKSRVIFVGDPCQLPPVGQDISPALDEGWLQAQGRRVQGAILKKIERTDTDVLKLATAVRTMSEQASWPRYPKLPARGLQHVRLYGSETELFNTYLQRFLQVGPGKVLAVARTNKRVQAINREMRKQLYGQPDLPLRVGDILLVTQNNYSVPLSNGDFVEVASMGETKYQAGLLFQNIRVKAFLSEKEYDMLLSLDILYAEQMNFDQEQLRRLMFDFNDRMRAKSYRINSDVYKAEMMTDPYLNCLRATYGYAVTCHKAQGGEWYDVFLFLEKGMYVMPRPQLCRWWYTAVTRARNTLHMADDWWIV